MIRLTALYRNSEGSRFDFDYYVKTHLQLARKRLADFGMGRIEVEKGIEALDGERAAYICVAHADFLDMADLKRGYLAVPHGRLPLLAENRRLPYPRSPLSLRDGVALTI